MGSNRPMGSDLEAGTVTPKFRDICRADFRRGQGAPERGILGQAIPLRRNAAPGEKQPARWVAGQDGCRGVVAPGDSLSEDTPRGAALRTAAFSGHRCHAISESQY